MKYDLDDLVEAMSSVAIKAVNLNTVLWNLDPDDDPSNLGEERINELKTEQFAKDFHNTVMSERMIIDECMRRLVSAKSPNNHLLKTSGENFGAEYIGAFLEFNRREDSFSAMSRDMKTQAAFCLLDEHKNKMLGLIKSVSRYELGDELLGYVKNLRKGLNEVHHAFDESLVMGMDLVNVKVHSVQLKARKINNELNTELSFINQGDVKAVGCKYDPYNKVSELCNEMMTELKKSSKKTTTHGIDNSQLLENLAVIENIHNRALYKLEEWMAAKNKSSTDQ